VRGEHAAASDVEEDVGAFLAFKEAEELLADVGRRDLDEAAGRRGCRRERCGCHDVRERDSEEVRVDAEYLYGHSWLKFVLEVEL
jgi:hypothetical protein